MHASAPVFPIQIDAVLSFALILCRTASLFVFLPIPGIRSALELPRLLLAVLFAVLLTPFSKPAAIPTIPGMLIAAGSEALLGLALGLCVGLILEGLQLGGQIIGLQAGFSYASTIDPASEADSAILQVLFTLAGSLLFFTMGFDTLLFQFLLQGVVTAPPGEWAAKPDHALALLRLFPPLFTDAIRLALPVAAVLLLIDVTLALFSRMQPQLQLLSLSFPLKMLAAVLIAALGTQSLPSALQRPAERSLETIRFLLSEAPRR
ncbi:MAG: flagellar biosynthetic protein FliR [Acidobacteria bacterium]|nr:flagellar biosynthetic protein FliR [Acidobacteriota bacterium]